MSIIADKEKPDILDKTRLYLQYMLQNSADSEMEKALEEQEANLTPIAYLKNLQTITRHHQKPQEVSRISKFGMIISNLLPLQKTELPLVRLAASIVDPSQLEVSSFDPKRPRGDSSSNLVSRMGFEHCLVFVVGGGCWEEQQGLAEWAQRSFKTVTYGATDWPTASEFAQSLGGLAGI